MIGQEFETLLADARAGDEAAFARLWRDLNPALLRYLALGEQAPEEVAAETWLGVVKGLRTFRGDEMAWRAWVFTTARRRAVDAARKRARESRLGIRTTTWVAPLAPDCAEEVEQVLTTAEAIALVRRLPPLQAEVVLLRVVAELSVEEVAGLLGRSPGAVRVAAHRGLRALSAMVGETGVTTGTFRTLREVT
ncbi:MAG TPA: RNA polymerase sigma factor [Terrabacter sp.]|nr:RNA polymerase sigma factor [Terrabacter sp.]